MDTREEEALLAAGRSPPRSRARDAHILSFAFWFVFLAYGAVQNLESSVNTEGDLGTVSLGVLYLSFTFFSLFASPMVRMLGSKKALVVGTTGYWLFIASNLKPTWYTMVPASLYLGYAASVIWVGQGTYLTSAARMYARERDLHEGTVIGSFNGEFWGAFASTQLVGNLISLVLLKNGKEGESVGGTTLLYIVFLGSMTIGTVLMCFLTDVKSEHVDVVASTDRNAILTLLKFVVAPLREVKMLLIIPLIVYSGLQQAFVWAEFTKYIVTPALGVAGVGGAMAVYGAADAVCSWIVGRFTSGLSSATWIVSAGSFLQGFVLFWILLKYSLPTGVLAMVYPLVMAVMWGIGDGVFNTQLNAILGMLFEHDTEAAFAQLKVWQSAAIALVFFLSPVISLEAMLLVMIVVLCFSVAAFLVLTLCEQKAFSTELS